MHHRHQADSVLKKSEFSRPNKMIASRISFIVTQKYVADSRGFSESREERLEWHGACIYLGLDLDKISSSPPLIGSYHWALRHACLRMTRFMGAVMRA